MSDNKVVQFNTFKTAPHPKNSAVRKQLANALRELRKLQIHSYILVVRGQDPDTLEDDMIACMHDTENNCTSQLGMLSYASHGLYKLVFG